MMCGTGFIDRLANLLETKFVQQFDKALRSTTLVTRSAHHAPQFMHP